MCEVEREEALKSQAARAGPQDTPRWKGMSRRERVMRALVEVVAEHGYAGATVGAVLASARVSRRGFYEIFPGGLDDGLIAVMDCTFQRTGKLVTERLGEGDGPWQEGVRGALAALLVFFDADRALAQVCFVETMSAARVRAHRERNIQAFRALIVSGIERAGGQVPPTSAQAVMASLLGMIYTHLVSHPERPLLELLGPLMSTAVRSAAISDGIASRERSRGEALARAIQADAHTWARPPAAWPGKNDSQSDVDGAKPPPMLTNPSAHRARACLYHLAQHPGSSNNEIAAAVGIAHHPQMSRLLGELARQGLIVRNSEGAGKRNAWRLSERGVEVLEIL